MSLDETGGNAKTVRVDFDLAATAHSPDLDDLLGGHGDIGRERGAPGPVDDRSPSGSPCRSPLARTPCARRPAVPLGGQVMESPEVGEQSPSMRLANEHQEGWRSRFGTGESSRVLAALFASA